MNMIKPSTGFIDKGRADMLLEKWAPVLNYSSDRVRPIEDEHARLSTAILMENQERWCIEEAGGTASGIAGVYGGSAPGQTGLSNSDSYATELITNEIVGVQPMAGPVGLAFAMRYKYETSSLGGRDVDGYSNGPLTVGNDGVPRQNDGSELGYQTLDTRFTGTSANFLTGANDFKFVSEDQGVAQLLSQFELTGNIPQVSPEFAKTAVEAKTRRLAARWSVELEQDMKNMNGLDVDSELTNAMSYEIQAEIDREMIMRMVQIALNAGKGNGYSFWYAASADARWLGERNRDFYSKIIVEANRIAIRNRRGSANFIVATPRVCTILEMLPEFQWMPVNGNVNTQPTGISKVGTVGGRFTIYRDTRTEAQLLGGVRNPADAIEYALLGYKGPEYYDTGIVYCPYIPVMIQRTIGPNDFSPRVGLMTRYGVVDHIFGASLYYHCIIVKGLGSDNVAQSGGRLYL